MTMKLTAKSIALAAGASFAISLAASPVAMADSNPFSMTKLSADSSMQLATGKCGEGKCGGGSKASQDAKCGGMKGDSEGKCGGGMKSENEGKCGGSKKKDKKEGKCGEGKCGGNN